eukprot:6301262-Pyramimonas_sp.AAC.1
MSGPGGGRGEGRWTFLGEESWGGGSQEQRQSGVGMSGPGGGRGGGRWAFLGQESWGGGSQEP